MEVFTANLSLSLHLSTENDFVLNQTLKTPKVCSLYGGMVVFCLYDKKIHFSFYDKKIHCTCRGGVRSSEVIDNVADSSACIDVIIQMLYT